MKITFIHTDLRLYWEARLQALDKELKRLGHSLNIIEIAGKGSPYSFARHESESRNLNWHILFPEDSPENLSSSLVKKKLHKELDFIRPDVLVAGAIAFTSGANAVNWASKNNKMVIIFDDTKHSINQRNLLVNFVKKAIYRNVDAMIYPANQWIETGLRWGFKPSELFFGVDVVDNDFWVEKPHSVNPTETPFF